MTEKKLKAKPLIIALSSIVAVCLIGLSVLQIIQINTRFPQTVISSTRLGDETELNGLKLKATSCEMLPYKSIKENEELYSVIAKYDTGEVNLIKACLTIKNNSDKEAELPLYDVIFQSNDWANAVNLEVFKYFNTDKSLSVKLESGESTDVVLPSLLHKAQFSSKAWDKIEDRDFSLVLSLYPQKRIIEMV